MCLNGWVVCLRYCWRSRSVPGVAGWCGVAGWGFPMISTRAFKQTNKQTNKHAQYKERQLVLQISKCLKLNSNKANQLLNEQEKQNTTWWACMGVVVGTSFLWAATSANMEAGPISPVIKHTFTLTVIQDSCADSRWKWAVVIPVEAVPPSGAPNVVWLVSSADTGLLKAWASALITCTASCSNTAAATPCWCTPISPLWAAAETCAVWDNNQWSPSQHFFFF